MLKLMRDNFQQLKWALLAVVAAFIIGFVYVDMGLGGPRQGQQQDTRSYAARVGRWSAGSSVRSASRVRCA